MHDPMGLPWSEKTPEVQQAPPALEITPLTCSRVRCVRAVGSASSRLLLRSSRVKPTRSPTCNNI
jgi:hypothetical protein